MVIVVYLFLVRLGALLEKLEKPISNLPRWAYRNASFYTMRTDALDRFGTPLEQRFARVEIFEIMAAAGLENVTFSDQTPYWCAVGYRRKPE